MHVHHSKTVCRTLGFKRLIRHFAIKMAVRVSAELM